MQWTELLTFTAQCEAAGVPAPEPVVRGLELLDRAREAVQAPTVRLLGLADDDVHARIVDYAVRNHRGGEDWRYGPLVGLDAGLAVFTAELVGEVVQATLPLLDDLIVELRPRFEAAAAPLVEAVQVHGLTGATTAEEIIERADEALSAAWRNVRPALAAMSPLVAFRIAVSDMFDVSPTRREAEQLLNSTFERVDHTVCFAAGDLWGVEGNFYRKHRQGRPTTAIDWTALAAGGLTLNTPDQVRAKQRRRASFLAATEPQGVDQATVDVDLDAAVYGELMAATPRYPA